jgi:hypothetical protein
MNPWIDDCSRDHEERVRPHDGGLAIASPDVIVFNPVGTAVFSPCLEFPG